MIRIVLADDHSFLRMGVESVLDGPDITIVASVDNGQAALDAVERYNPDVVILDVRMPGLGGVETLEAMRAAGDNRPVILLTAELDDAPLLAAIKARVNGIVFKQGAESRLQDAIAAVVSGERFIELSLMDRALTLATAQPRISPLDTLSARERQIAEAVAAGKRNREIADEIGITEGAIKISLHRIYDKLDVENRTELALLIISERRS